jgi:hypothetical protein
VKGGTAVSKTGEQLGGALVTGVLVAVIALLILVATGCIYVGRTLLATQSRLLGGVVVGLGCFTLIALLTRSGGFLLAAGACAALALLVALAVNHAFGDDDVQFDFEVPDFEVPDFGREHR